MLLVERRGGVGSHFSKQVNKLHLKNEKYYRVKMIFSPNRKNRARIKHYFSSIPLKIICDLFLF